MVARSSRRFLVWRRLLPVLAIVLSLAFLSILLMRVPASKALSAQQPIAGQQPVGEVGAGGTAAGAVSGLVTNQHGTPQQFVHVSLSQSTFGPGCSEPYSDYTQEDGTFIINNVPPGTYKVRYKSCDFLFHDELYFNQSTTITGATSILVQEGIETEDIDATITGNSTISGTVKNLAGVGIPDVMVLICNPAVTEECSGSPFAFGNFAYTDASGNYALNQMKAGSYKLLFQDYPAEVYLPEYYDDAIFWEDAISVTVGVEESVSDINAVLTKASTIGGFVRNEDGDPIEDAHLLFVAVNGPTSFGHNTIADGSYLTRDMPAGEYQITVTDPSGAYLSKQINFTVDEAEAETLNITLEKARKIHGHVTNATTTDAYPNVYISACPTTLDCTVPTSWDAHYAFSADNGAYEIGGLTSGNYFVRFDPPDDEYLTEYNFDALSLADASFVALTDETDDVMINAELDTAPGISGQVTALTGGLPISNTTVTVCRKQGDTCPSLDSTTTDAAGNYAFPVLLPGIYLLTFADFDNVEPQYLTKVYDANSEDLADATEIVLTNSQVTGKNVQMLRGATLMGSLRLSEGTPAEGARAAVCRVDGAVCTPLPELNATANASGQWQITGLRNGASYRLEYLTPSIEYLSFFLGSPGYIYRWEDAANLILGPEEVADLGTRTFQRSASISGKVYDDVQTPLEGIVVRPCNINLGTPCTIGGETTTDATGAFSVRGLRASPPYYYLYFNDPGGQHRTLYYPNAVNISNGTPITVTVGQAITGINMVLPRLAGSATATPTPTLTPTASPTSSATPPTATPSATSPATPPATPSATPSPTPQPTVIATIEAQPNTPAQITIGEAQGLEAGQSIVLEVPEGAVELPTLFSVGIFKPPPAAQPGMGEMVFTISAAQGGTPIHGLAFNVPVTLTITYRDEDVAGIDEAGLSLYFYNEETKSWENDGIVVISHDLAANRLVATLAHLTTFALFEARDRVLLPIVGK